MRVINTACGRPYLSLHANACSHTFMHGRVNHCMLDPRAEMIHIQLLDGLPRGHSGLHSAFRISRVVGAPFDESDCQEDLEWMAE